MIPLSHHRLVPIELPDSLGVHAPVQQLLELVVDPSMQAAVLCGHGEQLRGLLRLLLPSVSLDGPLRLEKGSTWILEMSPGRVGAARYLSPLRQKRLIDPAQPITAPAG